VVAGATFFRGPVVILLIPKKLQSPPLRDGLFQTYPKLAHEEQTAYSSS
jgi:hypothetical protein